MDRNLLLAFALSFLVLMLWTKLVAPPPKPAEESEEGQTVATGEAAKPATEAGGVPLPAPEPGAEPKRTTTSQISPT